MKEKVYQNNLAYSLFCFSYTDGNYELIYEHYTFNYWHFLNI